MLALFLYALVSLIVTFFLKPFLNLDNKFLAYLFPFGIIFILLLIFAPSESFDKSWYRYVGIFIGVLIEIIFVFIIFKRVRK